MQEIIRLVLFYLNGIWRYRWYALIVAFLICPVGWIYIATLPDEYRASARVFVDTDSMLTPLLSGLAVKSNEGRRLRYVTNILFSRENMEKLARMTDMDLRAKTPQQMDDLVGDLKRRVKLGRRGGNIYQIAFSDESPELAKRVVQSMLTIFVESNLGSSRQDQDSAERFLQREIKDYERRLIEAERKLKDFKMRNLDFISDAGSYYKRLKSARDQLVKAEDVLKLSMSSRDELLDQVETIEAEGAETPEYMEYLEDSAEKVVSTLTKRIEALQANLDEMLIRYTDRHPDIIHLRAAIDRLKQEQASGKDAFIAEKEGSDVMVAQSLASNALYQEMRLRLADAESKVVASQTKLESLREKIEKFQSAVDQVLQIEAEEKQLNRDYGIVKSNHTSLLKRLEQARLTRQVDTSVDTVKFRTLDPPKVPQKPYGPNRVAFSSMVFGGGVAGGLALAFLLSQLRPVFFDRRQLNEITGLPVLGSVNMVWIPRQKAKRALGNFLFLMGVIILIGSYASVIAVFFFEIDIMSKLPI